jgi:NAD(P)-dependent dehydrogenase (short-subunit alcohol dehydrogenase family)
MPGLPLAGRVALVAGAGRGIGREIAGWYSAAGADLVVCARTGDGISALADEVRANGGRVVADVCDVVDASAVEALVERSMVAFGRIDIAVANAAILGPVGQIDQVPHDEWVRTLGVNVGGTVSLLRAVLPAMKERGFGRVLTLSGGGVGGPNLPDRVSAYVASKAAVVVLTEALALELPPGVTINAIAPGAVPTGFMDGVLAVGPEVAGAALFDAVRSTSMPDLEPLRELALYLASDEAGWINGRCLSARWDSPGALSGLADAGVSSSRFRLRRIDEDLYGEVQVIA